MIGAAILVGIILIGIISLANYISHNESGVDLGIFLGIVIGVFFVIEVGIVSDILEEQIPTALDVYQGETTLEITYKDGVAIDSVVVWKEE